MNALLCALVVVAQTSTPLPPPPPPPSVDAPPPPPPSAPTPVPVANAPTNAPTAPKEPETHLRLRGGFSSGLGAFMPGPAVNFGIGELRGGLQITEILGVYLGLGLQAGIGLRASTSATGGSGGITANSMAYLALVAEATLGNVFFVGGGPLVGNGAWASVDVVAGSNGTANQRVVAVAGWMPGVTARIGVGFGGTLGNGHTTRSQWTAAIDTNIYFGTNTATVNAGSSGLNAGVSNQVAVGIAPMLMIGHEWK